MTTFLRIEQVQAETTLGRSTIYRLIERGQFPKPVPLVGNRKAWVGSDIEAWKKERRA